jgi:hypothetical protein
MEHPLAKQNNSVRATISIHATERFVRSIFFEVSRAVKSLALAKLARKGDAS